MSAPAAVDARPILVVAASLATTHREHEKFYAQRPLTQAVSLQQAAQVLLTLADRWRATDPHPPQPGGSPFLGCADLNEAATVQHTGVLFLEDGHEPGELVRLKRELRALADGFGETGAWLSTAMEAGWRALLPLVDIPELAGVRGERHRIVANDWQSAHEQLLIAMLTERALAILERIDFAPPAVRADLAGPRANPGYLYAAAELLGRAADLVAQSALLTHDNERHWRVFRERVEQVLATSLPPRPEADCRRRPQTCSHLTARLALGRSEPGVSSGRFSSARRRSGRSG